MSDPEPLIRELAAAQRAYLRGIDRRRAAVLAASEPGPDGKPLVSIYRIAKIFGIEERSVRSILKTAEKEGKA